MGLFFLFHTKPGMWNLPGGRGVGVFICASEQNCRETIGEKKVVFDCFSALFLWRHSLPLSLSLCLISAALKNWKGEGLSVPALSFGSAFRIYWPVLHPLTEFSKHQSSCFGCNPGIKKLFGKVFLTKNLSVWSTFQYFVWSHLKLLISLTLLALCVCYLLNPITPLYGDICFTFLLACLPPW